MQITRSTLATSKGSAEWFTGTVYIDPVAPPASPSWVIASCFTADHLTALEFSY